MKVRVTAKFIKQNSRPLCFGYNDIYYILKNDWPRYYTCGTYGWNADIYDFDGFCIVTGYRPFGRDAHVIPYSIMDRMIAADPSRHDEIYCDFMILCRQLVDEEVLDESIIKKYTDIQGI